MTEPIRPHLPDMTRLSAYLDGELDAATQRETEIHLATCPPCTARLAELRTLTAAFDALPQDTLGFDLAGVIAGRLAAEPRSPQERPAPRWWGLLPASLGAAAALTLGIGMGSALIGGGAAMPRLAAMSVFDTLPPGGLCLGPDTCYSKGARK
jgi:anti-sigma factor RsiW